MKSSGEGFLQSPPLPQWGYEIACMSEGRSPGGLFILNPFEGGLIWEGGLNLFRKDDGISSKVQEG